MLILSLTLLIISSYTDLRERGISVFLLAASLTSCIAIMIGVEIYGNTLRIPSWCLLYEPGIRNVLTALFPGMLLLIIHKISSASIGKGDVYVMFLLGLMLGMYNSFVLLAMSMFFTAVFGLVCITVKGKNRKDTLPFMPFLLGAHILQIMIILHQG